MLDALAKVGVFVVLVEALVQGITIPLAAWWPSSRWSGRWPEIPRWMKQLIAFLIAMAATFLFSVDAFATIGFKAVHPAIGRALTGIIVSRGSLFWHDLTSRFAPPKPAVLPAQPPSPTPRPFP